MSKQDLKIYPLKIDEKKLGEEDKGEILPQIPHLILCVGKVKSGKTVLYNSLYLSDRFFGKDFQVRVLLSPTAHQDSQNQHLIKEFDYIFEEVNETLIEQLLDMIKKDESGDRFLFVFDDVIGAITQKKSGKTDLLSSLATKYRHIANAKGDEGKLSIFIATQKFNFLTPILRNNCMAYFIMGYCSKKELDGLSEELSVFGGSPEGFRDIYKKSKKEKHDFLYLNMQKLKAYRNFDECLFSEDDLINHKNDEKK